MSTDLATVGETTVIVYGLDSGREYEISLDVVSPEQDAEPALASPVRSEIEVERLPVQGQLIITRSRNGI